MVKGLIGFIEPKKLAPHELFNAYVVLRYGTFTIISYYFRIGLAIPSIRSLVLL
jgi:hypothetical protein